LENVWKLCRVASDAYTLASTDIIVWLHRGKLALAAFLTAFGDAAQAARVAASASALKRSLARTCGGTKRRTLKHIQHVSY
jgi:hypothetical protein